VGLNPFLSALRAVGYAWAGRVHFPRDEIGAVFTAEDGRRFTVFRHVVIDPRPGQPARPGAVLIPRFHVAGMSVSQNILFSWLPAPFFIGLPGFRSKRWLVDRRTGDFAGYYEWDTLRDAEDYGRSFAARFLIRRATPGSFSLRLYPADAAPPPPMKWPRRGVSHLPGPDARREPGSRVAVFAYDAAPLPPGEVQGIPAQGSGGQKSMTPHGAVPGTYPLRR
jgi:hypothetical protein